VGAGSETCWSFPCIVNNKRTCARSNTSSSVTTTLWVERCEYLSDEGFCAVAQCSPLLEHVYITNCLVTDAMLIAVSQRCHNPCQLEIDVIDAIHDGLAAIAVGCPLLEEIEAWNCVQVGLAVEAIARSCPRLRVLLLPIAAVQRCWRWRSVARCWKKLEWEGKRLATRRSAHWCVAVLPFGDLLFLVHLSPSRACALYAITAEISRKSNLSVP
jgi:hypothetical protein